MNPEVKIRLLIHEDALATAPTANELRTLLPFTAVSHFVVERITVSSDRTRAPEIAKASTLGDQVKTWLDATEQSLEPKRLERILQKVDEVTR